LKINRVVQNVFEMPALSSVLFNPPHECKDFSSEQPPIC